MTVMRVDFEQWLQSTDPCANAVKWVSAQPLTHSLEQLWADCPRGSWLAYVLDHLGLIGADDAELRAKLIELYTDHAMPPRSRWHIPPPEISAVDDEWLDLLWDDRLNDTGDALYANYLRSRWTAQDVLERIPK